MLKVTFLLHPNRNKIFSLTSASTFTQYQMTLQIIIVFNFSNTWSKCSTKVFISIEGKLLLAEQPPDCRRSDSCTRNRSHFSSPTIFRLGGANTKFLATKSLSSSFQLEKCGGNWWTHFVIFFTFQYIQ